MKTEEFLKIIEKQRSRPYTRGPMIVTPQKITRKMEECPGDYALLMLLKEMTQHINFDCRFENGRCKNYRRRRSVCMKNEDDSMCCCHGCRPDIGYLTFIPINRIKYYARLYSKKWGFWRPGKGCTLPRKFRSKTCLLHACTSNKKLKQQLYEHSILIDKFRLKIKEECQLTEPIEI